MRATLLAVLAACPVLGQPAFDVASIKPGAWPARVAKAA